MAPHFRISRKLVAAEPYELWNAFLGFLCDTPESQMTRAQRGARLAFRYDGEIQNGGHLQYFENNGIGSTPETIEALRVLGAAPQAEILATALARHRAKKRRKLWTVVEFIAEARRGEYSDLDTAYYACKPDTCRYLDQFLHAHLDDFVEWVD